jgi:hypothetical protein
LAAHVKAEKGRRMRLETQVAGWKMAEAIRHLCKHVQIRAQQEPSKFQREQTNRFVKWARAIANSYDPFENGYIDEVLKTPRRMPLSTVFGTYRCSESSHATQQNIISFTAI